MSRTRTTGGSFLRAFEKIAEDNYETQRMPGCVFVDRGIGAVETISSAGHPLVVVYYLSDLVYAYGEWKFWTPDKVRLVEEETRRMKIGS